MIIKFRGQHSTEEAIDSLLCVLQLFEERYGIDNFRDMEFNLVLQNEAGDDIEIIDAITDETLEIFEVVKADDLEDEEPKPRLQLVVDNT